MKGFEIERQKLVYKGKIMADDKTVIDYNMLDNKMVVIMIGQVRI